MKANFDQYRVFRSVAAAGSISRAAAELYISQPAVSQTLRQLEDRLGAELFVRTPRGIRLTSEGEALYSYVEQACSLVEAGEKRIEELKNLEAGEVRIGASDTLCKYFLARELGRFHDRYPDISVRVTNGTSYESLAMLRAGQVDIAFLNQPISAEGVVVRPYLEVNDIFLCGGGYTSLADRALTWEELASLPLIMLDPTSNSRRYVDAFARKMGVELRPSMELGSIDVMVDFVRRGFGVGAVIKQFVGSAPAEGALVQLRVEPEPPPRHIGLATLRNIALSSASQAFVDMLFSGERL